MLFSHGLHISRRTYGVSKMSNGLQLDLYLASRNCPMRKNYVRRGSQHWKWGGNEVILLKVLTGKENIDPHQFFHLSDNIHGLRSHSLKLLLDRCHLDLRKNFFSQRVISAWNSLPRHVVNARIDLMLIGRPPDVDNKGSWPTEVHDITSTCTSKYK